MQTVTVGADQLPPKIDVEILAGATFVVDVPILGGDGTPLPADDVLSARAQVRPSVDSDELLHEFSEGAGLERLDDGGDAVLRLTVDEATSNFWEATWPGRSDRVVAVWDLEIIRADGLRHQITQPGTITLIRQITR